MQYVRSRSGATLTVRNPTDDSTITNDLQVAGEEDINTAVVAANVAFQTGPWSSFTGQQRGKCLFRLADLIEGDADSLLQLETMAMGVPKAGVEFMMPLVSKYLRCELFLRQWRGGHITYAAQTMPAMQTRFLGSLIQQKMAFTRS